MKTYCWIPTEKHVDVCEYGRNKPLKRQLQFSADFECGARNEKCRELAVSILADHTRNVIVALQWHKRFTDEVIAEKNPVFHWEITTADIDFWLAARRVKLAEETTCKQS